MKPAFSRKDLPMLKKLNSPWVGSIIGLICYLGVTAATWNAATANLNGAQEPHDPEQSPAPANRESWLMNNVEVEALVKELRDERENLNKREKNLNDLKARLDSERDELNQLTQTVHRLQKEFDQSVSRVTEEEMGNLKKLAKTYTAVEPESVAPIFRKMDDTSVVKIMVFMKEQESGAILAALARGGEAEAKRAADLTDKLRLAIVPKKK
jgi:flagellar motility protein MotE (MotC chaperone)